MPGFLVVNWIQCSSWPSHFGGCGFEKSLDHDSLATIGSWISVSSSAAPSPGSSEPAFPSAPLPSCVRHRPLGGLAGCIAVVQARRSGEFGVSKPPSGTAVPIVSVADPVPASSGARVLGLKKPLRLCCPLPADCVDTRVLVGLVRLEGLEDGISVDGLFAACGLFKPVDDFELFAGGDEVSNSCVWGGVANISPSTSLSSLRPCAEEDSLLPSATGEPLLVSGARESFLANMSLIFLRLSNSGISFADNAGMSFVEYSFRRLPSLNVPGGLTKSEMWTSLPPDGM